MVKVSKEEAVQWYAQNRGLYKRFSQKIHNILSELLEGSEITIHAITSRAKEVDSFKKKIDSPKYDDPLNQITDLSGIRVIAYVEDDLKPICKIIEETFDIDVINSADKSHDLGIDKVGYKSIHYIAKLKEDRSQLPEYKKFKGLKFEIQIRTILQHAWAEIEHDRNYKFNGVLPPEIKRRFGILAGTLELIDREFNQLSIDIDKISQQVTTARKKDELDLIPINTTTLKQYLTEIFKDLVHSNILIADFNNLDDEIIKELHDFDILTLKDLQEIIPNDITKQIKSAYPKGTSQKNFLGLVRYLMIINNPDKYFEKAWKTNWAGFASDDGVLLQLYNIDSGELSKKYDLLEP